MSFWGGFEKRAVNKSTYLKARAQRFAKYVQESFKQIASEYPTLPRLHAVYRAKRDAYYKVNPFFINRRSASSISRMPVDATRGLRDLRIKEHSRWRSLSNKMLIKMKEKDLGISGQATHLPKTKRKW